MGQSRLLKRRPKIGGELGYLGLSDWWLASFTAEERDRVEMLYTPSPASGSGYTLTEGTVEPSKRGAIDLLLELAAKVASPANWHLASAMLVKAEDVADTAREVVAVHRAYGKSITALYRARSVGSQALSATIEACEKQIALAPRAAIAYAQARPGRPLPGHEGFLRLAIIREKQGNYAEASRLAEEAAEQGWGARRDWGLRLARCEAKLARTGHYRWAER